MASAIKTGNLGEYRASDSIRKNTVKTLSPFALVLVLGMTAVADESSDIHPSEPTRTEMLEREQLEEDHIDHYSARLDAFRDEYEKCLAEWTTKLSSGDPDAELVAKAIGSQCDRHLIDMIQLMAKYDGRGPVERDREAVEAIAVMNALVTVLEYRATQNRSDKLANRHHGQIKKTTA